MGLEPESPSFLPTPYRFLKTSSARPLVFSFVIPPAVRQPTVFAPSNRYFSMSSAKKRKYTAPTLQTQIFNLRKGHTTRKTISATFNKASTDGRRIHRGTAQIRAPSPVRRPTVEDVLDEELPWNPTPPEPLDDVDVDANTAAPAEGPPAAKASKQGPKTFATLVSSRYNSWSRSPR